jgi:hypothetical protein
MSEGEEFNLRGGADVNTEREQGNESGKYCDHAYNGMAVVRKSPVFIGLSKF